ncbi:hypothetical protein CPAR01_04580 [Colletotrichum paranaense]|uniref:FAD-binding domain-containing protein n=1 Tax=Colletotrichum paranaense TaxID=1914294 RepID=A0ABQ9SWQ0_9PEZI|nr:uncharacterized protein CPAR01_04580 [Colletotrichum paranaense]KAK1543947.1 hypothetical protein CPAR01_04580 [Colletotrichum paranaense]
MKVVIIGAGIGGLVCAISCRREGLEVVVLEQAAALQPVGAGIQIPPNAARILRKLGLVPQLLDKATLVDTIDYLRYKDGKVLYQMEGGEKMKQSYGDLWMVIARPHYHGVLWSAAKEAGAELRLGTEAVAIDFENSSVRLGTGEIGRIALLGDACHPTLPYQAQGAAMAVEDGAVLGKLLGQLESSGLYHDGTRDTVLGMLEIYENLRKSRTTINVQGARSNQRAYHLPDGPIQESRDAWLRSEPRGASLDGFTLADTAYLEVILGFDALEECVDAFEHWKAGQSQTLPRYNL